MFQEAFLIAGGLDIPHHQVLQALQFYILSWHDKNKADLELPSSSNTEWVFDFPALPAAIVEQE